MKTGDKVKVTFTSPTGCPCGCGRAGEFYGVVAGPVNGRGLVPVKHGSGNVFYEIPSTVTVIT